MGAFYDFPPTVTIPWRAPMVALLWDASCGGSSMGALLSKTPSGGPPTGGFLREFSYWNPRIGVHPWESFYGCPPMLALVDLLEELCYHLWELPYGSFRMAVPLRQSPMGARLRRPTAGTLAWGSCAHRDHPMGNQTCVVCLV